MEYRTLGKSRQKISTISLGAWAYGGQNFWEKPPIKEIEAVIKEAVELGINMIDTALAYGDSEVIVGKAVKGIRDKLLISSKCGADPRKIPGQIDLSLKRMGLDYIDLYQVHYPDIDITVEETIRAMLKLQESGKIRHIGVSNFNVTQLKAAVEVADIAACQSGFNLMWREIEDRNILDFCMNNRISMLTYSSLGQGLFSGKYKSTADIPEKKGEIRHSNFLFKEEAFSKALEIIKILENLSKKYDKTPAQIAINWVIKREGVTSAIVGAKNRQQLNDISGATGWEMEKKDFELLNNLGSKASKIFDYSYNMFGYKYDDLKIDQAIEDNLKLYQ